MNLHRVAALAAAASVLAIGGTVAALADPSLPDAAAILAGQAAEAVCSNDGAWIKWALGGALVWVVTNLGGNLANSLREPYRTILHLIAGNLFAVVKRSAPLAFLVLVGLGLSACVTAPTGNLSADLAANNAKLQAMASQTNAYVQDFNTQAAQFAQKAGGDALAFGKSACGAASMLNGTFAMAAPFMAAAGVDPTIGTTEATVFLGVTAACHVIDDAGSSPAQIAQAAEQAAVAIPQIEAAIAAVSPGTAAAVKTAPAPAASSPSSGA